MFRGVPVGEGAFGGEPVRVWGFDAGGGEHLSDDLAPVGAVFGEGPAGQLPADEDASAPEAEVLAVVRRGGTHPGGPGQGRCLRG